MRLARSLSGDHSGSRAGGDDRPSQVQPGGFGAIRRGSRLLVLEFDSRVVGYVSHGRNRVAALPYAGEIFELYLQPAFRGVRAARACSRPPDDLASNGYLSTVVWALSDNERAYDFTRRWAARGLARNGAIR